MLASVLANVNRDEKKKPTPFTPEDFTPKFKQAVMDSKPTREEKMKQLDRLWKELKDG